MYKVKRAIIMAAGKGNRLAPITNELPKPLVEVNGIRMIDSVINALHSNGIFEIYIVVGYKKEQFVVLKEKYTEIVLIENPFFEAWNNISSLYVAREYIDDCFILDGDQIIYNPAILDINFDKSGYNVVWSEKETSEWLLTVKDGIVTSCSRTGGKEGWQLYSVSRWSHNDGKKLKKPLENEFNNGNKDIYWDDIALFCYPEEYDLGIYKMAREDIIEVDTFDELVALDPSYFSYYSSL